MLPRIEIASLCEKQSLHDPIQMASLAEASRFHALNGSGERNSHSWALPLKGLSMRRPTTLETVPPEPRYIWSQHGEICPCQVVKITTGVTRAPARDIDRAFDRAQARDRNGFGYNVRMATTYPERRIAGVASGSDVSGFHAVESVIKAIPSCVWQ